jgi:hypothetical protein
LVSTYFIIKYFVQKTLLGKNVQPKVNTPMAANAAPAQQPAPMPTTPVSSPYSAKKQVTQEEDKIGKYYKEQFYM